MHIPPPWHSHSTHTNTSTHTHIHTHTYTQSLLYNITSLRWDANFMYRHVASAHCCTAKEVDNNVTISTFSLQHEAPQFVKPVLCPSPPPSPPIPNHQSPFLTANVMHVHPSLCPSKTPLEQYPATRLSKIIFNPLATTFPATKRTKQRL